MLRSRVTISALNLAAIALLAMVWRGWSFVVMMAVGSSAPRNFNPELVAYFLAFLPWVVIALSVALSHWLVSRKLIVLGYIIAALPLVCAAILYVWW